MRASAGGASPDPKPHPAQHRLPGGAGGDLRMGGWLTDAVPQVSPLSPTCCLGAVGRRPALLVLKSRSAWRAARPSGQ